MCEPEVYTSCFRNPKGRWDYWRHQKVCDYHYFHCYSDFWLFFFVLIFLVFWGSMLYSLSQANPNSRQSLCNEVTDKSHHTQAAIGGIKALSRRYLGHQIVGYLVEFVWGEYLNLRQNSLSTQIKSLLSKSEILICLLNCRLEHFLLSL